MSNTAVVVIMCAAVFESLIVIVGSIFTIFVFWKHRNRLKRNYFLLISLAVDLPRHLEEPSVLRTGDNISVAFLTVFSFASVFFLVLSSLERTYALIWPLRHRVASTKGYIYSVNFAWVTGICLGVLTLLAVYDTLDFVKWVVVLGCAIVVCLIVVCVSYLAIRSRLILRVPEIAAAHNRQNGPQQNAKFSRTLFVVIAASLLFWVPSIVVNCIQNLCSGCISLFLYFISNMFRLTNSLVNPIVYSFRLPIFRETVKRLKLCKQEKKQYTVNYIP